MRCEVKIIRHGISVVCNGQITETASYLEKGEKKLMMYRTPADGNSEAASSITRCIIINDGDTSLSNCMKKYTIKCPKDSMCIQKCIKWVYDDKELASSESRNLKNKIVVIEKEKPRADEKTADEKTEAPVVDSTTKDSGSTMKKDSVK